MPQLRISRLEPFYDKLLHEHFFCHVGGWMANDVGFMSPLLRAVCVGMTKWRVCVCMGVGLERIVSLKCFA